MNQENVPRNTPLLLQGAMALQNLAATAVAPGIGPIDVVCLMSGAAAEQDSGSSVWPPYIIGGDSEEDASIRFAPRDFLSLGSDSNVAANDMAIDPSAALAVPVHCSSEPPPIHLQLNGSDAEAPRIGIQADDSQQSSPSAAADLSDSLSKLQSAIPANTNNELASLLAEGVTDQNMETYQQTREKFRTLSQLNDHTLLSEAAAAAFKENVEAPARKVKPRRKKHRAKVIREDKQIKKQKPAVTTPEGKTPNQKTERSYVRKKRSLSSLENCSGPVSGQSVSMGAENAARSRAASLRRRSQFEFCEQGVLRGQSSAGNSCHHIEDKLIHSKSSFCSAATVSTAQCAHGLHVDMENSPGGLAFGLSRMMNKLLDEYIHLPEMATNCTQEILPATSGCFSREPTRDQDSVGNTHGLDVTRIGVTILEGNKKNLEVNESNKAGFTMHRSATSVPGTTSTESQMTKVSRVSKKKHQQRRESKSSLAGSRDSIILRSDAQMLAFYQVGGIKKKRKVRVRRISYVPIMNVDMNRAQVLPRLSQSYLGPLYERPDFKLCTKKRSRRKRRHYRRSDGIFQPPNEMYPSLTTSAVVPFGATGSLSNSLVLFGSQMIIPYERPLDLVKKQHPRVKVDLDFETTRVWNLLMGKTTDEPVGGNDVEKERWWQQERDVFQGRANSFVARMQLVQGDRHFSPWKGSVVDSVVGVFLTQNVSDHLSSSAYMALAASFPPGTVNSNCNDDITSHDYEEIISTSAVGGVRMFDFFDNGARPDLQENLEELSITNAKIHVETKNNSSAYELTKGENYSFYSKEKNEDLCDHQVTEIDPNAQQLITSERSSLAIQFQKDMSSSQSVIISETILQSQLSSSSGDNYSPNSSVGSIGGASSQQLGSIFDSLAGNDASTKELECQRIIAVNGDGASQHGIPSTFEASDFQEHESLSVTDGTIAETANRVDESTGKSGFPSYNGEPDKAAIPKKTRTTRKEKTENFDWDKLRRKACADGHMKKRKSERRDSVDWEAVQCADVQTISDAIRGRGINNVLAKRIQEFLNRLVRDHGTIDLEWLRDTSPDSAKDYLLSIHGLGLKSVECVRLLTLHQLAFPVDTNVGRICVRLGWVPIQPLPESLQLHLLEQYPVLETVQKYLWPRLCKLDQKTLYELHYHMITFGKVFCTKTKPNCNACPMRTECRHFASAFTSARLALPAPQEKGLVRSSNQFSFESGSMPTWNSTMLPQLEESTQGKESCTKNSEPIIEEPASPTHEEYPETLESGIEDYDPDTGEIPLIKLNLEAFAHNLENCIKESNMDLRSDDIKRALIAISNEAASIPVPKLKNVRRLRTEHYVYEIPDSHSLVQQLGLDQREDGDPSPYLLTIWMQDDINEMIKAPKPCFDFRREDGLCNNEKCQHCVLERENRSRYVRATILVPCRTAMKGSFPLNGTYFQVNEVFADHKSSHDPIYVVREQLWHLERRMVYFGTSVPSIFKGLTTEEIEGVLLERICLRARIREGKRGTKAPKPISARRSKQSVQRTQHRSSSNRAELGFSERVNFISIITR